MGSKSPEGHNQAPHGAPNALDKPANPAVKAQNGSGSADLDRGTISNDDDDADDDEKETQINGSSNAGRIYLFPSRPAKFQHRPTDTPSTPEKKKKKRKRSKKKAKPTEAKQTSPPRVPLSTLFPSGYPVGELVADDRTSRVTDEETRYNSRLWDDGFLADYRQAAEIHRQVRQYAQRELIKPGATLSSIADGIEDGVRALSGHQGLETGDGLNAGMGFPTGLCVNHVAAHWTPNPGAKEVVLEKSDVLKVDFGVHVNGRIVDSAFTVAFDPVYDNLLEAVKEATNTGIAHAGIDARVSDIGAAIQEVMESYELEIAGKSVPVKAIRNITGHNILRYHIHGGKQVPFIKNNRRDKMEEGEVFAIETFGSTGKGYLDDDFGIYGYGRNEHVPATGLRLASARSLVKTIDANFGSLVFSRRYLERLGVKSYHLAMKNLIDNGIVESYAPLVDVKGSYTAQFEHTILLHSGGKEVISRGDDY
ncbi:putative methionine aminopeptidase, type II [Aspergillus clavatus NRRL 1]|uniref:Methionine aminopeptidase 2-1 n=1 Tax=Aspergillus clavatus (strain ATCC 1007 / CBS 513.65 / DSM 816 / NCTC 3887 / NRRL 1 / QM 1276 / 107) TaxID=344612 RepID=MAP21_ASPCL|nr:methionine aminopeptidase, type II, putative [Aspergillus clavatus NRRL 1]A1CCP2.1 RecName: Full=Methionine aminopeptidase 2-1; Short=MAP 2-1; Short=MetAP 2-1; AltName: Full=Peptidase M [Aspergillus clavatus NRRL 1]EAW12299.1 methionine aminopeptidase, type II, putative [Aspergillus clavatus NRRL 1]